MRVQITIIAAIFSLTFANDAFSQGKWSSHPDTAIFNYYTQNEISIDLLSKRANGKFVLVYYYEHFSIRVNNFNERVLGDTAVVNYILANFYPVCVDLDIDKLEPGGTDGKRSRAYRKFLKDQAYYVELTPAFSIYNPKGLLKGTKTFLRAEMNTTAVQFLEWMKKRLIN